MMGSKITHNWVGILIGNFENERTLIVCKRSINEEASRQMDIGLDWTRWRIALVWIDSLHTSVHMGTRTSFDNGLKDEGPEGYMES